jgi:hypothetical protein
VTTHNNAIAERVRFSETAVRNDVSIMKQKYRDDRQLDKFLSRIHPEKHTKFTIVPRSPMTVPRQPLRRPR